MPARTSQVFGWISQHQQAAAAAPNEGPRSGTCYHRIVLLSAVIGCYRLRTAAGRLDPCCCCPSRPAPSGVRSSRDARADAAAAAVDAANSRPAAAAAAAMRSAAGCGNETAPPHQQRCTPSGAQEQIATTHVDALHGLLREQRPQLRPPALSCGPHARGIVAVARRRGYCGRVAPPLRRHRAAAAAAGALWSQASEYVCRGGRRRVHGWVPCFMGGLLPLPLLLLALVWTRIWRQRRQRLQQQCHQRLAGRWGIERRLETREPHP
jgi:hypothetical protein